MKFDIDLVISCFIFMGMIFLVIAFLAFAINHTNKERLEKPCEQFATEFISHLPVRCIKYYYK